MVDVGGVCDFVLGEVVFDGDVEMWLVWEGFDVVFFVVWVSFGECVEYCGCVGFCFVVGEVFLGFGWVLIDEFIKGLNCVIFDCEGCWCV